MYPYRNEDVAWQRLLDIQREMDNSRIWAESSGHLVEQAVALARRAWGLAGLAIRRAPRRRPLASENECETA